MDLSALSGQLIPENWTDSTGTSESVTSSTTSTKKVLDAQLLAAIMSGLTGQMTDKEIAQYAENLLKPQLNAGIEAAQQAYETTKLSKEQEIENLAAALTRSIMEQEGAYKQNMAAVETAALARGMGRSSYTLESLANQGTLYAEVIRQLTEDTGRQQQQIQAQISQAAQQNAQTQGRLNTDYAATLAAKIQELKQSQQQAYNQNYLTAVSAAMGSQSNTTSTTTGTSNQSSMGGKFGDPNAAQQIVSSSSSSSSSGKTYTVG